MRAERNIGSNRPVGVAMRILAALVSSVLLAAACSGPAVTPAASLPVSVSPSDVAPSVAVGSSSLGSLAPDASASAEAIASSVPGPTPAMSQPVGSVPPTSTTSWTALAVKPLPVHPPRLSFPTFRWAGGYFALGQSADTAPVEAWISRDGRSWVAIPDQRFGLTDSTDDLDAVAGAACGNGLLVAINDDANETSVWSSPDGATWTLASLPDGQDVATLAGGPGGAVAATTSGPTVDVTTDCSAWRAVTLPGPATSEINAVIPVGAGYVAVGDDGQGTGLDPLAWWSSDGQAWSAAKVPARKGDGFASVSAGTSGLIATSTQPGLAPSINSFWTSSDGHAWAASSADPFGKITSDEGAGSAAGSFDGDGTRLFGVGSQGDGGGPTQYWVSADGQHWTRLKLTGSSPSSAGQASGQGYLLSYLMRDGVLFVSDSGAWFGTPRAG